MTGAVCTSRKCLSCPDELDLTNGKRYTDVDGAAVVYLSNDGLDIHDSAASLSTRMHGIYDLLLLRSYD
jgi:hypothetical protein